MNKSITGNQIAYRWALDQTGRPVPINLAQRGERYFCPLCHGPMIARLGDQLQHHFGHENELGCTSEAVTRAAVRRWITIQLRDALAKRLAVKVRWRCAYCGNIHLANVLSGVSLVYEGYQWDTRDHAGGHQDAYYADVAMVDAGGNVIAVILVQDDQMPTAETLHFFTTQEQLFTITIPASVLPAGSDINQLIAQGQLAGGPCPVLQKAVNIMKDPDAIRQALRDVVERWPGYFYAPLETVDGLGGVARIGNRAMWLTADRWRDIIGGMRNPLAPGVNVVIQTWPHRDGGQIWLYYATVRDTGAVGVRRYGPGQTPGASIDARFRRYNATALDLVRYFVTQ